MLEAVTDRRKQLADELRDFANSIETAETQPMGISFQVFWKDGNINQGTRFLPGFNFMVATGLFFRLAGELSCCVEREEIDPPQRVT